MSQTLMSSADTAWYRMNKPYNQMSITGLLELCPNPGLDAIIELFKSRLLVHERFRQCVRFTSDAAFWHEDETFDIKRHVKEINLKEQNCDTLEDFVSQVMSTEFDQDRPLWLIYLIDDADKKCATLVLKLHHSIADGIALIRVLLSMAQTEPNGPYFDPEKAYPTKNDLARLQNKWSSNVKIIFSEFNKVAASLWKFLTMPKDSPSDLKGELKTQKRAVWSNLITLDRIKSAVKFHNVTINDLLLWVTCNALRAYLLEKQDLDDDANIRLSIPVNLRTGSELDKMGNRFGLVFIRLPIGVSNSLERLRMIVEEMNEIKKSREAVVAFGVLKVLGRSPIAFENFVINFLSSKCTGVITNVPGPRKTLYLAGSEISRIMFWVPKSGKLGLGISLFSYNNTVSLGIAVDEDRVPDYKKLAELFNRQIEIDIPDLNK